MPTFDNEEILNMSTEGEMETSMPPVPEGEWPGYIDGLGTRSGTSEKGNDWAALDVTWKITDTSVAEEVGIDEPQVRQTVFLDFDDSGNLALGPGKNLQLGRLREAVGQNGPGSWSIGQLEGATGICRVEHREYNGRIFADVKSVAAA